MHANKRQKTTKKRDERIVMTEDHVYLVDGNPVSTGVTTFKSSFFPPFDRERIMRGCSLNKNGQYFKMKPGEITDIWAKKRDAGTVLHAAIENYLNEAWEEQDTFQQKAHKLMGYMPQSETTEGQAENKTDVLAFLTAERRFVEDGWRPFKQEWKVFSQDDDLAGTIDSVWKRDDEYIIIDWKRSGANFERYNSPKYAYHPIEHLTNCQKIQYSLQVNIYAYILQKHYGVRVTKCFLVQVVPGRSEPNIIECPDLQDEVGNMIRVFKHHKELPSYVRKWNDGQFIFNPEHPSTPFPPRYETKDERFTTC